MPRVLLRIIVVFACCAWAWPGLAQRHALDEPRFTRVGDAESINDGVVTALAEDDEGFVWIGTTVGLVRHDGYQLRPYPVGGAGDGSGGGASRFVRSLLATPEGGLWVGMEGEGLAHFDRLGERWTLHAPDATRNGALRHGTVRALARAADGTLWVGTAGGGLHRLAPGASAFERPGSLAAGTLPDDRVYALLIDRRGDLWIGTWSGLVRLSRPGQGPLRFEPVFSSPGADELAGRPVTMLGEGPDGRIWAGTRDGALARIEPVDGRGEWLERARASGDEALAGPGGSASFALAGSDEVWIGRDRALDLRDAATGELRQRLRRQPHKPWGLGGHNVVALLRDAAGQLWVGSYGGGLQRHHPTDGLWVRRGEGAEGSPFAEGDVRSLHVLDNGEIWAGTPEGAVLVFDRTLALRGQILPQGAGPGLRFAGGLVGAITQSADGTVWVGSDSGIHAFDRDRRLRARHPMGGVRTRRLLAARDGSVWAATQNGVHRLAPGGAGFVRLLRDDGQALAGNVNALVQAADGTVFVGGNTGLYRAAAGSTVLQVVPGAPGAELGSPVVLGLLLDHQGRLWVDTNGGLHLWRQPAEAVARFEPVPPSPAHHGGAAGSAGANLLEDAQGRIWTHQTMHDPRDGSTHELGPADGADIGTGWFRAYTALPDGRLLFGGSTGILVVEPERVRRWRHAPPVVATELRIDGQHQPPARLQGGLELRPGERSFALEFAALDFSHPARNRYRHRLEGLDKAWIETRADFRVASYGNLPPGRYRLVVEGSNRLGDWSPHRLQLPVTVHPAWWQTWWAQGGGLALVAAAFIGVLQLRTRLLRRRQAELEARVGERTRELEALSKALQRKSAELEAASLTDPLTGLHNRRFLGQRMAVDAALLARRRAGGSGEGLAEELVFFLIDLDHFKRVNDEHGHAAGDQVLVEACARLKAAFREVDDVVRWGGEEILVTARGTDRERAAEVAERALAAIAGAPFVLRDGQEIRLTASIGFAAHPLAPAWPTALDWTRTVDLADAALYVVKRGGRNGWYGLLRAETPDAQTLVRAAAGPLSAWLADGGLQVQSSRPFETA